MTDSPDTRSGLPIADTPTAITPEWLTAALRSTGKLSDETAILGVQERGIGTGQMCDSWRLTLAFDGPTAVPPTIVAKLPAADETSRATAKALRNYEKEVRFYQHLAPHLPIRTPHVYYADIDVETASFVLLLEDMSPAHQGDQLAGCTPEEATLAVDELAKLHSATWSDPTLLEHEWLDRSTPDRREFMLNLLPALWSGFVPRYDERLNDDVRAVGSGLFENLGTYLDPDAAPTALVHGDYRLDNLLFDETPGGVPLTVVDWQTLAIGPPLSDVAYFIGAGLHDHVRREVEEGIVRRYHADLMVRGIADYSWDRCWYDYRRSTFSGFIMAVAASMLVERTDRGDDMFMTMATRHARHALDLDAIGLLRAEAAD